jgi:hypothetical protein
VYHPATAFQSIAAYGALLKVSKGIPWQTDREVKFFANQCYKYEYNGKWSTLQEILERSSNFEEFKQVTIDLLGNSTFYGNLEPLMERYQKTVIYKRFDQQRGLVRRPRRRRGYNDKGSLRPKWKRGRNLPDPGPEREDRRNKVKHPLLNEQFHGGGRRLGSHPPDDRKPDQRKEVDRHDQHFGHNFRVRDQKSSLCEIQSTSWSP